ncbi:guanine deaminase [Caldimonas thermodepolymerans]|uniref:Guanine deaminase n=1 Tax=Caldimonas thermodepolymerans TaxID=215580 RepID=A0AA46HWT0_9BURK|nr:guanine deaminase [Caldimonas thermodepolymerans]TCP08796.1 guanine deaminase [Caldimonas thermodepolymerans]UZG47117.1 guanine deaminase [Caldimonas thermodepolymerans]
MTERLAVRADLFDFPEDPGWQVEAPAAVRYLPDHWLLVEDGRIAGTRPGTEAPGPGWRCIDHRGRLLLPGFIDTHVHAPQLDVIASYGTELLEWLNTYTFPAECKYADPAEAERGSALFLDALLASGTTAAAVFPTVHKVSAEALFAAAAQRHMRVLAGKVLMDRHAPDGLRDDVAQAERDCVDLIERWHGRGRVAYAVTPRFAATSTREQLAMAGRLCAAYPDVYMQTHVAENRSEVRWMAELFPEARSHLDIYVRHGLMTPRSLFAHGIWLDDTDRAVLREAGASIAFCPSSNMFIGSGLFDWGRTEGQGVAVHLASDVGGGTSLSMLRTIADGYKVLALQGQKLTAWKALYTATHGAARHLRLSHEIGHLSPGTLADFVVWDWAQGPVARRRIEVARDLHERVFAWMTLGDERNVVSTWVAGQERYRRPE